MIPLPYYPHHRQHMSEAVRAERARALQHVLANPSNACVPSNPAHINCVCCGMEVATRDAIECQQCSHLALPTTYFCSTACCADESHNAWHAQHDINEERRDAVNVNRAVGNMALAEDLGQFNEGIRNELSTLESVVDAVLESSPVDPNSVATGISFRSEHEAGIRAVLRSGQLVQQMSEGIDAHLRGNDRAAYGLLHAVVTELPGVASQAGFPPADMVEKIIGTSNYFLGGVCRSSSRWAEAAMAYCAAVELLDDSPSDSSMWASSAMQAFGLFTTCDDCAHLEKPRWMDIEGGRLNAMSQRIVEAAVDEEGGLGVRPTRSNVASAWQIRAYALSLEGDTAAAQRCVQRCDPPPVGYRSK